MTVYLSKFAKKRGIFEIEVSPTEDRNIVHWRQPDGSMLALNKPDWHVLERDAIKQVILELDKEETRVRNQMQKLRTLKLAYCRNGAQTVPQNV